MFIFLLFQEYIPKMVNNVGFNCLIKLKTGLLPIIWRYCHKKVSSAEKKSKSKAYNIFFHYSIAWNWHWGLNSFTKPGLGWNLCIWHLMFFRRHKTKVQFTLVNRLSQKQPPAAAISLFLSQWSRIGCCLVCWLRKLCRAARIPRRLHKPSPP
jgi:hypothetical protein